MARAGASRPGAPRLRCTSKTYDTLRASACCTCLSIRLPAPAPAMFPVQQLCTFGFAITASPRPVFLYLFHFQPAPRTRACRISVRLCSISVIKSLDSVILCNSVEISAICQHLI